ncbi:MAG TPA: hypothetical protein VK428_12860 [Acidimicrobiales bacterium]|nr:hypothetical protein [Acidimicrobiales bacterium]
MRVVRVVPDVAGIAKEFDYLVPPELSDQVRVGTSVRVALGSRRVAGWVVTDEVEQPAGMSLRPLLAVRGWGPPPAVVELCRWAAWRWAGPLCRLLATASAPTLVRSLPPAASTGGPPETTSPMGPVAELAEEALAGGGVAVVRLAPAHDSFPLVEAVLSAAVAGSGAGVLVVVPARQVADELAGRLRRRGASVALLPEQWASARSGGVVAVGTRAAALAPLPSLSAAVVLDAHDQAYHEERAPTWTAWQVVAERARRQAVPCWLVSSCPTLELLKAGRLVAPSRRQERAGWPTVEVVDRRGDDPRRGLYSEPLVRLLRWAAGAEGRRVLCVLNRRGRARLLACQPCGELARCARCGAALSEGRDERTLVCAHCGAQRPRVCARCGSARLRVLRVGVSRAREELEALAGTFVAEVTAESGDAGAVPEARVVVGTEAVLHRVRRADAVAFLDLDAELLAPRLGAAEQALALLARAARVVAASGATAADATGAVEAAGEARAERAPGRLLLQTRVPDHPVVKAALLADPSLVPAAEAPVRAELRLPPVTACALVSGQAAAAYGPALAESAGPGVEVLGPVDGTWSVRAPDHRSLSDLLAAVPRPPGRLRVEVDPVRG